MNSPKTDFTGLWVVVVLGILQFCFVFSFQLFS